MTAVELQLLSDMQTSCREMREATAQEDWDHCARRWNTFIHQTRVDTHAKAAVRNLHTVVAPVLRLGVKENNRRREVALEMEALKMQASAPSPVSYEYVSAVKVPFSDWEDQTLLKHSTTWRKGTGKQKHYNWEQVHKAWKQQYTAECVAGQVDRLVYRSKDVLKYLSNSVRA
jgi:hypothetical protein